LGGSLITDKARPKTPRLGVLERLASEIAAAQRENPALRMILGHGSGSFGHVAGKKYGTRQGVHSPEQWRGFTEVWWDASALNRLVMEALGQAGLPAIALAPVASVIAADGSVASWDLSPLKAALQAGLLPVVSRRRDLRPRRAGRSGPPKTCSPTWRSICARRILLAGIEPGVWADYPACTLIPEITPHNLDEVIRPGGLRRHRRHGDGQQGAAEPGLGPADPGLEVAIFSGRRRR
jgi:isopentenyl phosphate kinase